MDSLQQLYDKLSSLSSTSVDDLKSKTKDKVKELSGLVSEEGAIYIIANEMGVKLENNLSAAPTSGRSLETKKIEQINEAKVPINLDAKVLKKYDLVEFQSKNGNSGKVQSVLVGDDTGIIRVVFWGDKTELLVNDDIDRDTILRVNNGFVKENMNTSRMEVHFSDYSDLEVNPQGIEIEVKEIKPEYNSKNIADLEVEDRNVSIKATIVDVDIPRFYLGCPHTFKKVFVDEGKYISPEHGEVDPIKVPITNLVVSDSTGTVSVVAFRNKAEQVFSKKAEDIVNLSEDLEGYREISKLLVGAQLEVAGNISENQMSGELQLIINDVLFAPKANVEEVADDIDQEIKEDTSKTKEQISPVEEIDIDDDDLDIEEIDIDDDLL